MTQFHPLAIRDVRKETSDCVSISFDIPAHLTSLFRFDAGQNVTLKLRINGEEVRRSYSICSSPSDNELRIAIKQLDGGRFSSHANALLKTGDIVEVLPPSGRFVNTPSRERSASYLAFAAGSGITPVISILKNTLANEPGSNFTLIYGNRNRNSIIFKEQLEALKNRYVDRLIVHHILSREITDSPANYGRITGEKCEQLSRGLLQFNMYDHIYLCGPEQMIFSVRDWLYQKGISKNKIHFELFNVPGERNAIQQRTISANEMSATVKLKLDGVLISYQLPFDGSSILDGALKQGADLPYACKGGVCATCRARLISGEVEMDNNYALEQEELNAGYILTCQSHPRTSEVEIDFDDHRT